MVVAEWRVLVDDERRCAFEQMACDAQQATEAWPSVRFFQWEPPAVSFGFRQQAPGWFNAKAWHEAGLEWVERPTGGGIGFHGSDVSIAVVVPRDMAWSLSAAMRAVCESAAQACGACGMDANILLEHPATSPIECCLTEPSAYAVLIGGRKVAGFALRRYPQSWLIQGSLLVRPLPGALASNLPMELVEQVHRRATTLEQAAGRPLKASEVIVRWRQAISEITLNLEP